MSEAPSGNPLDSYRLFLSRIDQFCSSISEEFAAQLHCRAGCSSCCRHLSLFAVEAANLLEAIARLPMGAKVLLAERVSWDRDDCPLLADDLCLVYPARPVICRTHGFPLLLEEDGQRRVSICPDNFQTAEAIPGRAVMNLETINNTLVALNALFLSAGAAPMFAAAERFTLADLLRATFEKEAV